MIVIDWLDANKAMDIAAMEAKEKRDAELVNRRTTILRLSEYAYRGAVSWAVDSFADQVEELLKDEGFRDEFKKWSRPNLPEAPDIKRGAST